MIRYNLIYHIYQFFPLFTCTTRCRPENIGKHSLMYVSHVGVECYGKWLFRVEFPFRCGHSPSVDENMTQETLQ